MLELQADRVLVVGDSHGDIDFMRDAVCTAVKHNCRTLIQLGDFGYWPGTKGATYLSRVNIMAAQHKMRIIVVEGNHDWPDLYKGFPVDEHGFGVHPGQEEPWALHAPRGIRFMLGGYQVGVMGGAVSIDAASRVLGRDWWPEELPSMRELESIGTEPFDIFLTHSPMAGSIFPAPTKLAETSPIWRSNAQFQESLREIAECSKPRLHLHGHMHYPVQYTIEYRDGSAVQCRSIGANVDHPHQTPNVLRYGCFQVLDLEPPGISMHMV